MSAEKFEAAFHRRLLEEVAAEVWHTARSVGREVEKAAELRNLDLQAKNTALTRAAKRRDVQLVDSERRNVELTREAERRDVQLANSERRCAELAREAERRGVQLTNSERRNAELTHEAERRDVRLAGELFELRHRIAELTHEVETAKRQLAKWATIEDDEKGIAQLEADYWVKLRKAAAEMHKERSRRLAAEILGRS